MKKLTKVFCALLCALLLPVFSACAEGGAGICYRVTGGQNELFLLGTIHIGSEKMYPMGEHILSALQSADTLVMECDTESGAVLAQTTSMMSYPVGDTLDKHVSPETYAKLGEVCEKLGYSINMMNALRPWAVVSMLSLETTAAEMGADDIMQAIGLGVETQIGALAGDKPRAYLETAVEQLKVMDGFSPELQEYMLASTLEVILDPQESVQPMDADLSLWPEWWANGEADKFADSYLAGMKADPKPELMDEYHQGLVTNRNKTMADGLRALLESPDGLSCFAMVGLLHLVLPDDSVIDLLTDMGYTVERVMP